MVEDVEVAQITTTCTAELSSMIGVHSILGQGSYEGLNTDKSDDHTS